MKMMRLAQTCVLASLLVAVAACGPDNQDTCSMPAEDCGGLCVDTRYDPQHCGACGVACGAGESCDLGTCVTVSTCGPGTTDCGGTCADTNVDPDNCGGCGVTCNAGEVCDAGACALFCPPGFVECNGACVDPNTDRAYCGATADCQGANAGVACASGEVCNGSGVCELSCQAGLIDCNGTCVDPNRDDAYCGATGDCQGANAGVTCAAGEVCNGAGVCETSCQTGLVDCNGTCVDGDYDPNYCGATGDCQGANAGQVCAAGEYCATGACVPTGVLEVLMPAQTSTFSPNVRGYWFTAPSNFIMVGIRVPNDIAGNQSIEVIRLAAVPPAYPTDTTAYTSEAYIQADPSLDYVPISVTVNAGDVIGILGQRGTTTSYAPGPATVTISGQAVTIERLLYQGPINTGQAGPVSQEPGGSIGRIEFQYISLP